MTPSPPIPPRCRALLARILDPRIAEDVLGDLEERFGRLASARGRKAAVRWYRLQTALICLRPSLLRTTTVRLHVPPLHGLAADVRYAWRAARSEPVTTVVVVASLALGVASLTGAYGAVQRLLFRLPEGIARPESVVEIYRRPFDPVQASALGYEGFRVISPGAFQALMRESTTLEGAALFSGNWELSVSWTDRATSR